MRPERIAVSDDNMEGTRSTLSPEDEVTVLHGELQRAGDEIAALRNRVETLEGERAEIRAHLEGILQALDALRGS
jgi:predicted  nucleic acid-binding Zn-ribbon protein